MKTIIFFGPLFFAAVLLNPGWEVNANAMEPMPVTFTFDVVTETVTPIRFAGSYTFVQLETTLDG